VWSQDFLVANLPVTFRTGELKKHREKVLFDREKVRLPMYMDDARRYKEAVGAATPLREELHVMKCKYDADELVVALKKKTDESKQLASRPERHMAYLDKARLEIAVSKSKPLIEMRSTMTRIRRNLNQHIHTIQSFGHTGTDAATDDAAPETRHRRIIMACPATGCAGFVDTLWKCGICNTKVCKDCRVIKSDEHECNDDDVATANAIAAESKPCPKCAASISKVSGCDQMWCTMCHTTFSWKTGKVETSVIHNPHYFQWLSSTGRTIPRADVPGMPCDIDGNIMRAITYLYCEAHLVRDLTTRLAILTRIDRIAERNRQRLDLEDGELRRIRERVRDFMNDEWRRKLCVKRLIGEISETEWQIALQRAEKAHHKERAWLQLMEMYVLTTRDILGRVTLRNPNLDDILNQHDQLHKFVYEQNLVISKSYGCIVLKITPDMRAADVKEKKKQAKPVGGAGAATVEYE
jgi:hypothetical protein